MVNELDAAYASCQHAARSHYENFPVASLLVPASMRRHVAALYAFARAADDFADEGARSPQERQQLLDGWRARLNGAAGAPAAGPAPRPGEPSNAVYSARIAADGSLGTWTTLAALPLPRTNQELAVVGDFLVIAGGAAGMGGDTTVLAARVRFPQDGPIAD